MSFLQTRIRTSLSRTKATGLTRSATQLFGGAAALVSHQPGREPTHAQERDKLPHKSARGRHRTTKAVRVSGLGIKSQVMI